MLNRSMRLRLAAAASLAAVAPASFAGVPPARWHEVKCARYASAWRQALAHYGREGLGAPFLDHHALFLASGCTRAADVCPRSPQELKLANVMVVLSMNAGTASTFPPFACRS